MTDEPLTEDSAPDWRESLPDDMRDLPIVKDTPDVPTLVKRLQDTQAMVGSSVRIPTDAAGQEDIAAFNQKVLEREYLGLMQKPDQTNAEVMAQVYNSLGRPEDPGGYESPEGVDAQTFGAVATTAFELGLSKQQYAGLAAKLNEIQNAQIQQVVDERDKAVSQVRNEWGASFDERVTRAKSVVQALGGHELLEQALSEGTADAPTLRLFDAIATQMGKEGTEVAKQLTQVTQQTSDELRQRRDELIARQLSENLTPGQRQQLQSEVVKLSERIMVGN